MRGTERLFLKMLGRRLVGSIPFFSRCGNLPTSIIFTIRWMAALDVDSREQLGDKGVMYWHYPCRTLGKSLDSLDADRVANNLT